jgi:hypothetical protein
VWGCESSRARGFGWRRRSGSGGVWKSGQRRRHQRWSGGRTAEGASPCGLRRYIGWCARVCIYGLGSNVFMGSLIWVLVGVPMGRNSYS